MRINQITESKATKTQASYQPNPKNNQKCINCTMWRDPDKCTAVEGKINKNGWCKWFQAGAYGKHGKINENNNIQYLLHGSPNNNLTLNQIQLFNPQAKQNKNNKKYGGFYTTHPDDINQAQKYATPSGSIYKIEINPQANIITKNGDITRLTQDTITQYLDNNVDIIKGKDPRGYTEYAIINTNIIKNVTKLTNLNENQIFNYEKYKPEIIKYIERIKNNKPDTLLDTTLFYNIITNKPTTGAAKKSNITINPQTWKTYFSQKPFNTNGVWSQRDFNINLKSTQNNINYYLTIEKSNNNIINFIQNLHKLDANLQKLATDTNSRISYKTHTILDAFIDHNDSLKIYYNNPQLKSQITNITKEWAKNNNIILANRTHQHGLDTDKSFGERLAITIEKTISETITKYKDQYTNDQYFEWIKKYLQTMIQTAKDTKSNTIQ